LFFVINDSHETYTADRDAPWNSCRGAQVELPQMDPRALLRKSPRKNNYTITVYNRIREREIRYITHQKYHQTNDPELISNSDTDPRTRIRLNPLASGAVCSESYCILPCSISPWRGLGLAAFMIR